jgi:carboxymethylenebutenolidase
VWNSFNTDDHIGVHAETTTFTSANGDSIHAYAASPVSDTKRGGIVVLHHNPGFDEFFMETTERLARHGYDVIAPDLFCRYGHGQPEEVSAKVRAEVGFAPDEGIVADCAGALAWLKALPSNNGKVGIIGACSGGRQAVLAASLIPEFDAVVDLWGGMVVASADELTPDRPVAPIDYTPQLDVPLLGLFGNDDLRPTPEKVDIHEAELKKYEKNYEFHRYDGAGHAFFRYDAAAYRQEQAMDGWEKVFQFFADNLSA